MEKALVVGANTRPVACSLKKLGYTVYSVDYFCTKDLMQCSDYRNCVLSQKPYKSCGRFVQGFNSVALRDLAKDFITETDFIICTSGASPENFPKNKIIGNKDVGSVEDKYKLYKKLEGKFKLPETHIVHDLNEAYEIASEFKDKKFLLKPLSGSGGIGIRNLEDRDITFPLNEAILQEIVEGESLSASVLSGGHEARTILTSRQIIGRGLGQIEPYGYCGNIAPSTDDLGTSEIAEGVVNSLNLVGSNGVDMIRSGDDIYVIEVNPRFQGTFECAEAALGINMVEAHIKACQGELLEVSTPKKFAVKMIVFAKERSIVGNLDFEGVYDIPHKNVIIEKGEPVATVVTSNKVLEDAVYSAKMIVGKVYKALRSFSL
ncbi:ATP-grasp domain-containing protein [Methanobacterium paludis]|uniref:ATP-grasp fold domain protein, DUF201-type n=1 Tax=Methanobacterium paludis (strain DSM 25820 / JCM 18151 / SWAN1) TaxID=868131 RepID=F6D6V1_METPW|nr:ATP-grasp domain-containing protein [Methanobacterium paludis]AEG18989.1 ATP-grasp fold domain protein, DUF201-type [Methanobacterium paludis]